MRDMDHAAKNAVSQLASELGGHLREEISQNAQFFKNTMIEAAESIEEAQKNLQEAADGLFEKLDGRIVVFEKNSENVASSLNDIASGFGKEIGNWVGFLSATSHAHSKELDALSSEMSELFKSMKAKLLSAVDEQISVRDGKMQQEIKETKTAIAALSAQIEERGKKFEKNVRLLMCVLCLISLLLVLAFIFLL